MRNLVMCGLILLALALNSGATAPVQLSGSSGLAILNQIAGSAQANNTSTIPVFGIGVAFRLDMR